MPLFPIDSNEPVFVSWLTVLIGAIILIAAEGMVFFKWGRARKWRYLAWIGGTLVWIALILTLPRYLEGFPRSALLISSAIYIFASFVYILSASHQSSFPMEGEDRKA